MEFSETCEYSDIVLPCAHYFEYDWIQASSHTPFLYMANKVADPIGEAKEDVEIFRAIASAWTTRRPRRSTPSPTRK